jgi:hypothetical protein
MGLKGYRLWAMGQLDSNVQSPTTIKISKLCPTSGGNHAVAVQVDYESAKA